MNQALLGSVSSGLFSSQSEAPNKRKWFDFPVLLLDFSKRTECRRIICLMKGLLLTEHIAPIIIATEMSSNRVSLSSHVGKTPIKYEVKAKKKLVIYIKDTFPISKGERKRWVSFTAGCPDAASISFVALVHVIWMM